MAPQEWRDYKLAVLSRLATAEEAIHNLAGKVDDVKQIIEAIKLQQAISNVKVVIGQFIFLVDS